VNSVFTPVILYYQHNEHRPVNIKLWLPDQDAVT